MTTQDLRLGFAYGTKEVARMQGTSPAKVRKACERGELWSCRGGARGPYHIAMDIDATERLVGGSTEKSRKARAAAGA